MSRVIERKTNRVSLVQMCSLEHIRLFYLRVSPSEMLLRLMEYSPPSYTDVQRGRTRTAAPAAGYRVHSRMFSVEAQR